MLRWLAAGAAGLFGLGIAVAATSASQPGSHEASGWQLLPYIEQDNVYMAASYHAGGVNISLGDGSVRFIASSISPGSWRAVGTHDGGEVVSDY
jgi:prepilin-type processing-associated H-X9-DG protein